MTGSDLYSKYWLPWLVGMPAEVSYAACSLMFGNVLGRLPNLRVCLSHGGGSFPWTIGRIQHGFDVRPDLVAIDQNDDPRSYLSRFYYDAHVCDAQALQQLVTLVGGPTRVMLGSDYPFPLGEIPPGSLIDSIDAFDQDTKDQMFHKTALDWLGLDIQRFL